jgi:hypothetical protein
MSLVLSDNRIFSPAPLTASAERLAESSQHVKVTNTNDAKLPQRHLVMDRHLRGHELAPGETKELDMLVRDIEYFDNMRKPGRLDAKGQPLPKHPIKIDGEEGRFKAAEADDRKRTLNLAPGETNETRQAQKPRNG